MYDLDLLGIVYRQRKIGEKCIKVFVCKSVSLRPGLMRFNSWFLLLRNFSVAIFVSPHVCLILDLILISMFLR